MISKYTATSFILFLAILIAPDIALARKAETMLVPTRIVIEDGQKFFSMIIKNNGDATGQYTIEAIDMDMKEDGSIVETPTGTPAPYSAVPFVHLSPRSVTLSPGKNQTVRILLKTPKVMEAGEYRSHVKVRVVDDSVEDNQALSNKDATIKIKANLVLVIPLIIRHGKTSYTTSISDARIANNTLSFYIHRDGNRSTMGDVKVFQNQGGKMVDVGTLDGVPVYRGTARRYVSLPLTNLRGNGELRIQYNKQATEGTGAMAEAVVHP
jgi:P pilus assembly chaperone PapD